MMAKNIKNVDFSSCLDLHSTLQFAISDNEFMKRLCGCLRNSRDGSPRRPFGFSHDPARPVMPVRLGLAPYLVGVMVFGMLFAITFSRSAGSSAHHNHALISTGLANLQ